MTKKIEMTKTEAKAAGKPNTAEYNTLLELMKNFPSYQIEIKTPAKHKNEFKGLDYDYMQKYIQKSDKANKDAIMEEFNTLTAQAKKKGDKNAENMEAASYFEVKNWFLATFPEIQQFRDNHKKQVQSILDKIAA